MDKKLKNKFKIYDNQLGHYWHDGQWFTIKEAIEDLADYHGYDWEDEEHKTIEDYLKLEETDEDKLAFLCDHGDWDIHEAIYIDENGNQFGGEYYDEEKITEHLADYPKHSVLINLYLN